MVKEDLADVLGEFARTMVTDFPIQGILDHLVQRIVEILPITAAGVTLIAPDLQPRYIAASDASALRYEKLQTELSEGPCLAAYDDGVAISVPDLRDEDRFPVFAPRALESGLAAVFTFPLHHGNLELGALDLYRDTPGVLSPESTAAAQTLADVAASYLINAQARADLQDSSDQSREAALHDPLTGLPNRVLMLELLERAFQASRRSGRTSAVFLLDMDRFKRVNDTYGHQVGDELLVALSHRLKAILRPGDSLARLSGDEFVILCEDLVDRRAADPIALRVMDALAAPFILSSVEVNASASIGIAFTGEGGDKPEDLLRNADMAMYRFKRDRSGHGAVLDLRELHLAGHQAGLARWLPGALERGELHIVYQPIVETVSGSLTGVEALLRWTHPSRGAISPDIFIPFAEQSGQIIELGRWVLQQACADSLRWQREQRTPIGIAVNVSAYQFMSAGFAATLATILDGTLADPGLLTLEVTESVFVRDEERALVVLDQLKEIGVALALDDFGTGYSSLAYLNTLPIDVLKIDHSFIAKLAERPGSKAIVTAIVNLAHGLGMSVVAEGVETVVQHDAVIRLGCDGCQGHLYARPMRASALEALVGAQTDGTNLRLPSSGHDLTASSGGVLPVLSRAPRFR